MGHSQNYSDEDEIAEAEVDHRIIQDEPDAIEEEEEGEDLFNDNYLENCRRRRRVFKRRIEFAAAVDPSKPNTTPPSIRAGNAEEQGFESIVIYESDREDDYYSALDDILSVDGSTRASPHQYRL